MLLAGLTAGPTAQAQSGRDDDEVLEPQREQPRTRRLDAVGDPGRIAATESAFARAAREEGQWTAFARFAAPGALLHGAQGTFAAAPWLAAQANPPATVDWQPTAVWASCDGTLSVSFGRSRQPDGTMGSYATVWELQGGRNGGRDYRWTYDMGGPDVPQPPPPPPRVPPSDEVILVPGLGLVDGKVADCPRGRAVPPLPPEIVANTSQEGGGQSGDGTLRWRWEHRADGARLIVVSWLRDGRWQTALHFGFAADGTALRPAP